MRDEFLITRSGKQYVLFAGLLDEAHTLGLKGIDTELLQVPDDSNGNMAVIKATVEMEDGRIFSGIGDASPDNVGRNIAPHIIRMAETRAKARALRDAVNVGATALEELSDGDDAPPSRATGNRPAPVREVRSSQSGASQSGASQSSASQSGASQSGGNSNRRENSRSRPQAVETPEEGQETEAPQNGQAKEKTSSGRSGTPKARKSQVDLLRTLAAEWAGEGGVERLENRIGKTLPELTRPEADEWIDKLTPDED